MWRSSDTRPIICTSLLPLRAHRQDSGFMTKLSREGQLISVCHGGRIHDLSSFSNPIIHCATFTYLGQGWMKGLLRKWGRGGRGHAQVHIHQHGLILSSRLCLLLARRAWRSDLEKEEEEECREPARLGSSACPRSNHATRF